MEISDPFDRELFLKAQKMRHWEDMTGLIDKAHSREGRNAIDRIAWLKSKREQEKQDHEEYYYN